MGDRPRVGISACLLGDPVRYDGRDKRDAWLVEVMGSQVEWVSVCPEVEAGFGTPREPMHLVDDGQGGVALLTSETKRDVTDTLKRYADRRVDELARADLDGYVLKADSPSCGLDGPGLFAATLVARLPELPVVEERHVVDDRQREDFIGRVWAHYGARTQSTGASAWRTFPVIRVREGRPRTGTDKAATEEPLEIRLHGRPFAVIMRTPGADRELAAGFLLAERVISGADDLGTIEYCTDRDPERMPLSDGRSFEGADNTVNVTLVNGSDDRIARLLEDRRQVITSSSCGLCGRQKIESLATDVDVIQARWTVPSSSISQMPVRLRERQTVFDETGGLHAAGLFAVTGDGIELVEVAEDVGRHNAVDKISGRMLMRDALPLSSHALCVSGRTSFEIVQKAVFAGIPMVAAVSAPSTLAIALAEAFGVTLLGFVRDGGFTIYTHTERVDR